jgi:hypothetical protein
MTSEPIRFFWFAERIRSTVMLIFLLVTSAQLSGTCIVALAYEKLCLSSPTAALSDFVMSVQLRLLAKAPGLLRPSLLELATALAVLATAAGLDAAAVGDDAMADGETGADDPIAADAAGGGPLLPLFEVHALSKVRAMHAAVAAVATARRWW